MGFEILLLAATLSCASVDDLDQFPVPDTASQSCAEIHGHDTLPLPKMLDPEFHARMHEKKTSEEGAKRRTIPCSEYSAYYEKLYFSSAAHTTVVGWRFRYCDGSLHYNGSTSPYCDRYVECCEPPYENEINTCEGS